MNKAKIALIYFQAFCLLVAILIAGLIFPAVAMAGGDDHHDNDCDHPRFQEVGCTYPGEQGPPGEDGADGRDGRDGIDGVDGKDGRDGIDGIDGIDGKDGRDGIDGKDGRDGKDGEVPTEWITNVNKLYDDSRSYSAAMAAMRVDLPQYQQSRLTFSGSRVAGRTGIGVGYAYMLDNENNAGLTIAVGRAGSETAIQGSFGFEFGGDRPMRFDISHLIPEPAPMAAPEPVLEEMVIVADESWSADELVAQLTDEQYEDLKSQIQDNDEDYAMVEQRQVQQAMVIESQADELARLKREAEALKAEQEARKKAEAEAQEKFKSRLAAKGD